uniref:Uncharacterized protein n=1 Tax=Setaria italica TaxID=4555 RepID=K4AN54_SETIT
MLRRWDRGRRDPPKEAPGHGAGGWTKAARHRWRLRESSSSGSGPRVWYGGPAPWLVTFDLLSVVLAPVVAGCSLCWCGFREQLLLDNNTVTHLNF